MELQRRLLRVMLWLLGLSAAAGVLAAFLSTFVMGRVAGTALIAAISMAAAMPTARLLDHEKKRMGGIVGLGSIVIGFIVAMTAVWIGLFSISWIDEFRLAMTAVIIDIGGVTAGALLATLHMRWIRWTALTAIATDAAALGLFLIGLWGGTDERPAETGGHALAAGAAASLALLGLGIEHRPWRWLGVLASAAGLVWGIDQVWYDRSINPTFYTITMCLAAVIAYAVMMLRVPLGEARFWTLLAAIGSTAGTGACVSAVAVATNGFTTLGPELLTRITGALAIISACSTLAIVVIYWLNRRPAGTCTEVAAVAAIHLVCPLCGKKLIAKLGESQCDRCNLLITVGVREPHCSTCNYSLLNLKGDRCPECGTPRPQP